MRQNDKTVRLLMSALVLCMVAVVFTTIANINLATQRNDLREQNAQLKDKYQAELAIERARNKAYEGAFTEVFEACNDTVISEPKVIR